MKLMKMGLGIAKQETDPSLLSNWDMVSVLALVSAASSDGLGTSTLSPSSPTVLNPRDFNQMMVLEGSVQCLGILPRLLELSRIFFFIAWPWLCMLCVLGNIRANKGQELPWVVLEHYWLKWK